MNVTKTRVIALNSLNSRYSVIHFSAVAGAKGHAIEFKTVAHQLESQPFRDLFLKKFDLGVLKFQNPTISNIDEMIVVLLRNLFVPCTPITEIVTIENICFFEQSYRPVDRRNRYLGIEFARPLVN